MKCKYIIQNNGNSIEFDYWGLRKFLLNSPEYLLMDSMLFSALTDVYNKLSELKLFQNMRMGSYGDIVEDDIGTNNFNILHFIDSQYFDPGQNYYLKMNDDAYRQYLREEGWSEDRINQLFARFKLIGSDSYAVHYLINNFHIDATDEASWNIGVNNTLVKRIQELKVAINEARLTNKGTEFLEWQLQGFERLQNSLTVRGSNLGALIMHSLITTARQNRISSIRTKRIRNIGLSHHIDSLGINLLGHIDQAVIDEYGNITIYQHKVTSEPPSVWNKSKRKKYEIELAFLRNMLAAKGFSANKITLKMIPTQIIYDDANEIKEVRMLPILNVLVNNNYTLGQIDDLINLYIEIPNVEINNISEHLETANNHTLIMFPDLDLKSNEIIKSVDSFISLLYNPRTGNGDIKRLIDDPLGYSYSVTINGNTKKIRSDEAPKNNQELKDYLQELFTKQDLLVGVVLNTLIKNIQTSRRNANSSEFDEFKRSHYQLVSQLSKYINPVIVAGEPVYEWEIIDNEELRNNHILLFKNSKGQIDVVALSTANLNEVHKKNGSTNILNSYLMDMEAGNLFNYNASFGHIKLILTLNILNEILPELHINYKLGNLLVISTFGRGLGIYTPLSDLVSTYYNPIISVVNKHNDGLNLLNKLSGLNYVDLYALVAEHCQLVLNLSSYYEDGPIKTTLKDAIETLEQANDDSAKRTALSSLLEYLQNNPIIKRALISNINFHDLNADSLLLISVYNLACIAFNKLNDIHVETKYKPLSTLLSMVMKPDAITDNNFRAIKGIVTRTTFRANERIIKDANSVMNASHKYLDKVGYGKAEGSIIGNENKYFDNMFVLNYKGEKTMMFKNPYKNDVENEMTSDEKMFMKRILFEMAKVTYSMHNKKFDFTSPEDARFIEAVNTLVVLRQVPLMRASNTVSFKGLKNNLLLLKDTTVGLVTGDNNIFAKWLLTLDKEGGNRSMYDRYDLGVINPFAVSMSNDPAPRQEALNSHNIDYWETNIPAIFYNYLNLNILTQEFNKSLILIKSVLFLAKMLALNANNVKYLNWLLDLADKYLTVNVFKDSLLEDTSKKVFTVINPLKHFVSKVFLSFNIKSAFRDTLEGFQLNYMKVATKYGVNISKLNLTKAYGIVVKGSFTSVRDITLLNLLCIKYGLSNLDFANIANGLRTDKSGITHMDDIAYQTMKRPDFLNRMTLFVARALLDGAWEAYSIDDEGNVKYDWRKDKRYAAHANKNSSDYKAATSRYYSAIRLYNKEHIDSPIDYNDDLPSPYSLEEIDSIKQVADSIYGNYDKGGRAMAENVALGMAFGLFSTYSNGIIANWFGGKRVIKGDEMELQTNELGQPLFFKENGEITTEDTGIPVEDKVPIVVLGVLHTLADIGKLVASNNSYEEKKAMWKRLNSNPLNAANIRKLLSSAAYSILLGILFKFIFDPGYKEAQKDSDNVLSSAVLSILYNGGRLSTDNFKEILVPYQYMTGESSGAFSSGWLIPFQSYPTRLVKSLISTISNDDKHWGEFIVNNTPSLALFKEATKQYYKENK